MSNKKNPLLRKTFMGVAGAAIGVGAAMLVVQSSPTSSGTIQPPMRTTLITNFKRPSPTPPTPPTTPIDEVDRPLVQAIERNVAAGESEIQRRMLRGRLGLLNKGLDVNDDGTFTRKTYSMHYDAPGQLSPPKLLKETRYNSPDEVRNVIGCALYDIGQVHEAMQAAGMTPDFPYLTPPEPQGGYYVKFKEVDTCGEDQIAVFDYYGYHQPIPEYYIHVDQLADMAAAHLSMIEDYEAALEEYNERFPNGAPQTAPQADPQGQSQAHPHP